VSAKRPASRQKDYRASFLISRAGPALGVYDGLGIRQQAGSPSAQAFKRPKTFVHWPIIHAAPSAASTCGKYFPDQFVRRSADCYEYSAARQTQNLTRGSVFPVRESLGSANGQFDSTGRKMALAAVAKRKASRRLGTSEAVWLRLHRTVIERACIPVVLFPRRMRRKALIDRRLDHFAALTIM